MPPKFLVENLYPILIGAIFGLLATLYSIVTPLFEAPDELWHYPFVWHLARNWQLPVQDPANPQLWQQEGSQPPLYYGLAALLSAPLATDELPALLYRNPHADIGRVSPDGNANIVVHTDRERWPWQGVVLAIHLVRLFSVALGVGTVLAVYALAGLLWPENRPYAGLAMAFVAFNPMFIFIAGSVNNDNLIICLASLILWRLVKLVRLEKEPALGEFGLLGGLLAAAALAKVSGLGLVGLTGLTLLVWGWRRRSWRIALRGNGIIAALVAGGAGWWYWRNFQLYGDWSGTTIMIAMMGPRPFTPTFGQFWAELSGLVRSFWGLFGYFSLPLPALVYPLLNGMFLIGLAGFLWSLRPGRWPALPPGWAEAWPILAGWLVILLAGFVQWTLATPATQGRLLFPALGVLAVIWAGGWLALFPARWAWLPAGGMLLLAAWVPAGVIAPAYARPALLSELPASAQPLAVTFAGSIRLLGYDQVAQAVEPGDQLALRLYWQALAPLPADYTVFIHLVDDHDLIVAQRDVFPGPGLFPTSQWPAGPILADRYVLQLPNTAYAPARATFAAGLYNAIGGERLSTDRGQDRVQFGQLEIRPKANGPLPNPQRLLFEENILLAGYTLDRRQARPGETVVLTLYWHSKARPGANYKVFVHLTNAQDIRAGQHDSDPQNGAAPTGQWSAGQTISDAHRLTINPEAQPGAYRFIVGLYQAETGRRLRLVGDGAAPVQADSVTLSELRVLEPAE
jgi:hypothetical protein